MISTPGETLGRNHSSINPQFFVLKGTSFLINVFNISSADFYNNGAPLDIEVPPGSTVIINVDGAQISLATGIYLNGQQESDQNNDGGAILFNFSDATSVRIAGQLDGSILAPSPPSPTPVSSAEPSSPPPSTSRARSTTSSSPEPSPQPIP